MRGMGGIAGVMGFLVCAGLGSGQTIPGYTISPANIQLYSTLTQQVVIINPPSTSVPYQFQVTVVSSTGAWLQAFPSTSGGAVVGAQTFSVIANLSGLVVGTTYTGIVRVTIGSQVRDIPVTLTVTPASGFVLLPGVVSLRASQPSQVVTIVPSGSGGQTFQVSVLTGAWLSVSPASGTVSGTATFTVTANVAGLPAALHMGVLRVVVGDVERILTVMLTMDVSGGSSFRVTPNSLSFEYTMGCAPPLWQSVALRSNTPMLFSATIVSDQLGFLRLSMTGGTTAPDLSIDVYVQPPANVTPGTYTAQVQFRASGQPDALVNVTLVVKPPPCESVPASVSLNAGQMQRTVQIRTWTNEPRLYSVRLGGIPSWLWSDDPGGTIRGSKDILVRALRQPGLQPGQVYHATLYITTPDQSCEIPVSYTTPNPLPVTIFDPWLPGGTVGVEYNGLLRALGGDQPYTWSQTGLPDGLTLDAATGVVSGTPVKADSYVAKFTVRDSANGTETVDIPIPVQRSNPSKLSFVPMKPCRVMETRAGYNFEGRTGSFGPPFLGGMETRTLTLPASNVCQIPAAAQAYVLNVTAIPRGALDYVAVYAGDESQPQLRTVSSPDGQIVANSTLVRAGSGGTIKVLATHDTDVLMDISGYFTGPGSSTGLLYYPVSPCRAVETRAEYRAAAGCSVRRV